MKNGKSGQDFKPYQEETSALSICVRTNSEIEILSLETCWNNYHDWIRPLVRSFNYEKSNIRSFASSVFHQESMLYISWWNLEKNGKKLVYIWKQMISTFNRNCVGGYKMSYWHQIHPVRLLLISPKNLIFWPTDTNLDTFGFISFPFIKPKVLIFRVSFVIFFLEGPLRVYRLFPTDFYLKIEFFGVDYP